jgi:hypothetical protein
MRIHLSKTKANLFAISNVFNSRVVVLNLTGSILTLDRSITNENQTNSVKYDRITA